MVVSVLLAKGYMQRVQDILEVDWMVTVNHYNIIFLLVSSHLFITMGVSHRVVVHIYHCELNQFIILTHCQFWSHLQHISTADIKYSPFTHIKHDDAIINGLPSIIHTWLRFSPEMFLITTVF